MKPFLDALKEQVLLFDGSMGALLSSMGQISDCPELLNIEKPELIESIHASYINAGANVIITNSLGSNAAQLEKAGLGHRSEELTQAAVKNACKASANLAYVALDIGPTGEFLEPLGSLSLNEMIEIFYKAAQSGKEAGADLILLETMTDIGETRAACIAARKVGLPVVASFTFEQNGRTMTGGSPECAALCLQAVGASAVGINCSTGPAEMLAPLKAMRAVCPLPIVVQPNAGLPQVDSQGHSHYPYGWQDMLPEMQHILDAGASAIGGCCGTTPEHIRAFAQLTGSAAPAPPEIAKVYLCSDRNFVSLEQALTAPVKVDDLDDLYELDPDDPAVILDLTNLTPDETAEYIIEAQSICKKPFIFKADREDVLAQALHQYVGIAGVLGANKFSNFDELSRLYGAVCI